MPREAAAHVSMESNTVIASETKKLILEPEQLRMLRTFKPLCHKLLGVTPRMRIATLSRGLERVLFNPGVHWLQDPRTNVYNFDPLLQHLPQPDSFDFANIPPFTPASKDTHLLNLAEQHDCSFISSTSSISSSMSHIHHLLTKMQPLNLSNLSAAFVDEPRTFTVLSRSPSAVILKPHRNGKIRSIVVEKLGDPDNVLQHMGQVMERLLTESKENFRKMLKNSGERPLSNGEDAYTYTAAGKLLLRSQLDCHDPRLPKQTFDLKTRAVLPIRMDVQNYQVPSHHLTNFPQKYSNYRLLRDQGMYCSFEREYFDMCRSTMLKYKYMRCVPISFCSFQAKIGDMDGIFVAYHNVSQMFGFQYVPREEMDQRIYGNSTTGDAAFRAILQLYNEILAVVVVEYPKTSLLRLTFSTDKLGTVSFLVFFSLDLETYSIWRRSRVK